MAEFTITIQTLPAHTTAALRSMLTLLEPVVGARWKVTDQLPADVVLLPAEQVPAAARGRRNDDELPLLLALTDDDGRIPHAFASLKRPVTAARVVEALQLAEGQLHRLRSGIEGPSTVPLLETLDGRDKLAPATFDARVRTSLRAAAFRLLQAPVAATLLDDKRESIFTLLPGLGYTTRLPANEVATVFRANPPVVLIELAEPEQRALRKAREFHPLRELEWTFWISARAPWLRPELDAAARYRLRRWPDFGRLPHYQGDIRMASFLMAQALPLAKLQEMANVKPEAAMNFLNAAYAVGALVSAQAAAPAVQRERTPPPPKGFAAVIAQLRRKFGFAAAG